MDYIRGVVGLFGLLLIAWALSGNRKNIDFRLVGIGIGIQVLIGLLIANVELINQFFSWISAGFVQFLNFGLKGAEFLYGDLAKNSNAIPEVNHNLGFLFVFQALPTVIFFSAVTTGLYYLGWLQKIVYGFAWL